MLPKPRVFGLFALVIGALVIGASWFAGATPAVASSLHLYGAGASAVGTAGSDDALANNYLATWTNPARLAFNKRVHFGLGTHLILPRFTVDQSGGHDLYPAVVPQGAILGHLGVSSPIGGVFGNRLGIGIHLHIPMGGPTRIAARDFRTPQVAIYDSIENRLAVVMGLGGRITDWLSIGASVQLLATLDGRADFSLSVLDRRFTKRSLHIDLLSELSPIASIQITPTDSTELSVIWRSAASVNFQLPVRVDIEKVGDLRFEIEGTGLFTPDQLVVAAAQTWGRWTVTGAATWARWSQLPPMAPRIDLDIDNSVFASDSGNDQLIVVRNRPVPMAAKDILVPRVGVQWQATEVVRARAGARYRPTPLPKADGTANYLDAPAITTALGVGFVLRDDQLPGRAPLTVDVGLGWTKLQRRTVTKRDPNDPVVATSIAGDNLRLAVTLHHDF